MPAACNLHERRMCMFCSNGAERKKNGAQSSTWLPPLLPAVQPQINVGATVVTNDPPYPEHQTAYQRYMEAVE